MRYDFYCEKCRQGVTMTLSLSQREGGDYTCPKCGGKRLQPVLTSFFSKTSRKS